MLVGGYQVAFAAALREAGGACFMMFTMMFSANSRVLLVGAFASQRIAAFLCQQTVVVIAESSRCV
jgi:hypothetical protein